MVTWIALPAGAAVFGGIDAGYVHDNNFIGAPVGYPPVSDTAQIYSAYVGGYKATDGGRGAWLGSVNVRVTRLQRYTSLDNDLFGGTIGYYHKLGVGSMLATIGGQDIRYGEAAEDFLLYFTRLRFKQGTARVWVTENAEFDDSHGGQAPNAYRGYSVWGSLNGRAWSSGTLSLSLAHSDDRYNISATATRITNVATCALKQQLGDGVYARVSYSLEHVTIPGGQAFHANLFAAGVGMMFG